MSIIILLTGLTLLSVVAVLFIGVLSMLKGGAFNKKYGHKNFRFREI